MQNPSSMVSKSEWYFSSEARNACSARLRSVTSRTVARSPPTSGSSNRLENVPSTQRPVLVPDAVLEADAQTGGVRQLLEDLLAAGAVFGVYPLEGIERHKLLGGIAGDALGGGVGVDDHATAV